MLKKINGALPMEQRSGKKESHAKEPGRTEIKITLPEVKGINWATATTAAAIILLILVAFQAYQARTLANEISEMEAKAAEANRLPAIEVTAIEADCAQCTPLAGVMAAVTAARVNITKQLTLAASDEHSKKLITDYSIKKLPAVVVKGEIDKASLQGFTRTADALIYAPEAPYVDAATGTVKGLVTLTLINASSCAECTDLMPGVQQLRELVTVKDVKIVDKDSDEGKALVEKYSMAKLPGILVSSDIAEYPLAIQLAAAGTPKKDGSIALGANPPYFNASTGKVDGIASLILLNDSSCTGCYDVTMHIPIVERFQVYLGSTKTVDSGSAEGKALISKYGITAVPTILITGDAKAYDALTAIWRTVGTVEEDGTYAFRTMSAIAGSPYKDLATGKIEQNVPQQQQ